MLVNTSDSYGSKRDEEREFEISELDLDSNIEDLRRACGEDTYQDLFCYARSIVECAEASEDIVQQAFTNTLTAIERGVQIDNMGGFLYRCVRNLCVNHVSREPRHSPTEEILLVEEQSAAASAELRYRWQKVEDTVDKLPSSQRDAFLLAEVRGLRYDEIANVLGRSTSSVRQLLNRARETVRARADVGSDWAAAPIPVVAADSAPESWYTSLASSVSDWVHPKVSELHAWLGNVSQTCTDTALQSSNYLATGAVVVAVAATSPAPSIEQPVKPLAKQEGIHRTAPAASSAVHPGTSASRPHSNTTAVQTDESAAVSTAAAPAPSDVVDRSQNTVTREKTPTSQIRKAKVARIDDNDPATTTVSSTPGGEQGPGSAQEEAVTTVPEVPIEPPEITPSGTCADDDSGSDRSSDESTLGTNQTPALQFEVGTATDLCDEEMPY